jgi:hypothetical protein
MLQSRKKIIGLLGKFYNFNMRAYGNGTKNWRLAICDVDFYGEPGIEMKVLVKLPSIGTSI